MPDLTAFPGPQFWEDVRRELDRTEASSVELFSRDEMSWLLTRFSMAWDTLEVLDDSVPHARFGSFVALGGCRYVVPVTDGRPMWSS